ncbi:hypothetical protein CWS72_11395 [Telmatospirillum siberiense]|uniref:TIGR02301 family protein n=1 Tax=Telmatospirillum siberiense TaxID=382514 RepID=A0A2N3PVM0_9PROT|nr:hypothetical protein CWS72_11395 [Telmatospirillum siberiense]
MVVALAAFRFFAVGATAQAQVNDPLIYYQVLYLSFLERTACGDDVKDWRDNLRTIRDILVVDMGRRDQDLSAIEGRAADLQREMPCDSDTRRDLLAVTTGEPRRALAWFGTLKTVQTP